VVLSGRQFIVLPHSNLVAVLDLITDIERYPVTLRNAGHYFDSVTIVAADSNVHSSGTEVHWQGSAQISST
jgi:hypothetical protein